MKLVNMLVFFLNFIPKKIINLLKIMTLSLTWTPDPNLLTNLAKIASQQGKNIESTLSEAVQLYLENQPIEPEVLNVEKSATKSSIIDNIKS